MKKLILIVLSLFTICGCTNIKNESISSLTKEIAVSVDEYNTVRTGFKYYLPVGLVVDKTTLYNEVIKSTNYTYYLYVDVISYYNKTQNTYEKNENAYYSEELKSKDKFGYIEINLKENNQYLIEIMFNYAKIEVMVDYEDINLAVDYAVSILRSIEYNDNIIANILGEDILNYQEEVYNIFNTTSSDSIYLKYEEADKNQETEEKDEDLIS